MLNFVNGVFSRAMNRDEYEIDYDDAAALKPGLPVQSDDPAVEIHILGDEDCAADEFVDTDPDAEIEELSREEVKPDAAAQIIKELLGTQMLDQKTGQLRSVQARDIVVLSRSVQSLAPKALEVLLGEGIPAYAESGGGYFDTYEVRQLLELMRVIDNRLRDYDLLGVLHSPMFGFTATDLARYAPIHRQARFRMHLRHTCATKNCLNKPNNRKSHSASLNAIPSCLGACASL